MYMYIHIILDRWYQCLRLWVFCCVVFVRSPENIDLSKMVTGFSSRHLKVKRFFHQKLTIKTIPNCFLPGHVTWIIVSYISLI